MARKKRETAVDSPVLESDEAIPGVSGIVDPGEAETTREAKGRGERLSFSLTADGRFDLESMREATREKLQQAALRTPELFPAAAEAARMPDMAVGALWGIVGMLESTVIGLKFGPEAAHVFQYSREEIGYLMEPTQAVLSKYVGRLAKYREETTLALVFAQIHMAKMQALRVILEQAEKAKTVQAESPVMPDLQ